MTVSAAIEAILTTAPGAYGIAARTVVAIPPSSLDPWPNTVRVRVGNTEITRTYDPDPEQ